MAQKKADKRLTSFRIRPQTLEALRVQAQREARSMTNLAEIILIEGIRQRRKTEKKHVDVLG